MRPDPAAHRGEPITPQRLLATTPGRPLNTMPQTFPVILVPQPEGGFFVECPSLPGCYSQGETKDEALENIREAISLALEDLAANGEQPVSIAPPIVTEVRVAG